MNFAIGLIISVGELYRGSAMKWLSNCCFLLSINSFFISQGFTNQKYLRTDTQQTEHKLHCQMKAREIRVRCELEL